MNDSICSGSATKSSDYLPSQAPIPVLNAALSLRTLSPREGVATHF